jgi:hypothetical protein
MIVKKAFRLIEGLCDEYTSTRDEIGAAYRQGEEAIIKLFNIVRFLEVQKWSTIRSANRKRKKNMSQRKM